MSPEPNHQALRYDRAVEASGSDSLSLIAQLVTPGSVVLDLGAATGALGKYLHEEKGCTVDGAELDPAAAAHTQGNYRELVVLDLEKAALADHFPPRAYDAIVCADVLEHLRDPGSLLAQLPALLAPGGRVLVSIPNVGYAGIVAGLLAGEFKYTATGLLDETHLRFFTRKSLFALLEQHGLHVRSMRPVLTPVQQSEFETAQLDALPPAVFRTILAQPDALTYQFIVEAAAEPLAGGQLAQVAEAPAARLRFSQLYWAGAGESLAEEQSAIAAGVVGESAQTLIMKIPARATQPVRLRLDVADRPGFLRLQGLQIKDAQGALLWSWDGAPQSLGERKELTYFSGALGGTWLSTGDDPGFELPLTPAVSALLARGGSVALTLDWPLSADYHLAQEVIDAQEQRGAQERKILLSRIEQLERALAAQADGAAANTLRAEKLLSERFAQQSKRLAEQAERLSQLEKSSQGLAHQGATTQHRVNRVAQRLAALEAVPSLRRTLKTTRRELLPRRFDFDPVPQHDLRPGSPGEWRSIGSDPHFTLVPRQGSFPSGWVDLLVELDLDDLEPVLSPMLYVDSGEGFLEQGCVPLPPPVDGLIRTQIRLPPGISALRFDPLDAEGAFRLGEVSFTELGKLRAGLRLGAPIARRLLHEPERIPAALRKTFEVFRKDGVRGLKHALVERSRTGGGQVSYAAWVDEFDRLGQEDRAAIALRIQALPGKPLFSILMPVYETPEKWLRRAIASVREQLYGEWELCIADDASKLPHVRKVLEEAAASDPRIKVAFRERNGHIAQASNTALGLATGEFVVLLDHDDELAPHALYMLAEELAKNPSLDLLYSDEDKIDESGNRYDPFFKPEWNPDLLHSINYVAHLGAYRTSLVRQVNGFRAGTDGSQDYDLCLRVAAKTQPARIRHIPHVLYHWRSIAGSTAAETANKGYAVDSAMKAVRDHFSAPGIEVLAGALPTTYRIKYPLPAPPPLASLIIPTRDGYDLLERCVRSVREKTTYLDYEILIVDNQTRDPKTLAYFKELTDSGQARILPFDAPFNYSAINNYAVREAKGEIVCLLNNDVEIIAPEWLRELVSQALRPGIGAVGAKLLYPDDTLQHAGVLMGLYGVAGHVFRALPRAAGGYFGRAQLVQGMSGVTAACLAIRKGIYQEVGGLDEENLKIAFNDVDFCLRVQAAGYQNLYTPYAELYHHESASRGLEDTPEKQARFARETEYMKRRWGRVLVEDPAYNPNLSLQSMQMEIAWPPRVSRPWREPQ